MYKECDRVDECSNEWAEDEDSNPPELSSLIESLLRLLCSEVYVDIEPLEEFNDSMLNRSQENPEETGNLLL